MHVEFCSPSSSFDAHGYVNFNGDHVATSAGGTPPYGCNSFETADFNVTIQSGTNTVFADITALSPEGEGYATATYTGTAPDTQAPVASKLQPSGDVYTSTATVQVDWCDDHSLSSGSRWVKMNGATQTTDFASAGGGSCGSHYTSSVSGVALNLGSNTLSAHICDDASNCTTDSFTVVRRAGPLPTVSLAPYSADLQDYSRCANACFAATYAQSTVPYFSLDAPRSVTVAYNSDRASPKPFIHVDVTHGGDGSNLPSFFYLKVKKADNSWITFLNGETSLHFVPSAGALRLSGQFSAAANSMAGDTAFPVTVVVGAAYTGGSEEATVATRIMVVNEAGSAIARGWTLPGIQRLYPQAGGSALITEGDGSAGYFAKIDGAFQSPVGDFSALTSTGTSTSTVYTRAYGDSTKVTFNYLGRMTHGRRCLGQHDQGALRQHRPCFNDSGPQRYDQGYHAELRHIRIELDPGSVRPHNRLHGAEQWPPDHIADPDGVSTVLAYDDSLRLSTVTDRRGVTVTEFRYHNASNRVDSVLGLSITLYSGGSARPTATLAAWQIQGVPYSATSTTAATPPHADTVRATVTDAGGHAARYTVNSFGQPAIAHGPLGDTVAVLYTSSAGQMGLPDSIIRSGRPGGSSLQRIGLDTLVTAEGRTTHLLYRHGFGIADTIWGTVHPRGGQPSGRTERSLTCLSQIGLPAAYTYDSRGRVLTGSDPEGHQAIATFGGTNGNRSRDSIPDGPVHVYGYDTFGRLTSDSVVGLLRRTMTYDTLNRVLKVFDGVNDSATRYSYDSLMLRGSRDPAGNLDSITYNAAGWAVTHRDPAGNHDTVQYDVEGQVRRAVNRRGQAISFTYDAGHRLRARGGTRIAADTVAIVNDSVVTVSNSAEAETQYINRRGQADSVRTVLTISDTARTYIQRFRYRANGLLDSVWITGPTATYLTRRYGYDSTWAVDSIKLGGYGWTTIRPNSDGAPVSTHLPGGDSIGQGYTPAHIGDGPEVLRVERRAPLRSDRTPGAAPNG